MSYVGQTCAALAFELFAPLVLRPNSTPVQIKARCESFKNGDLALLMQDTEKENEARLKKAKDRKSAIAAEDVVAQFRLDVECAETSVSSLRDSLRDECEKRAMYYVRRNELGRACTAMERCMEPQTLRAPDFEEKLRALHPTCSTGLDIDGNPLQRVDLPPPQPDRERFVFIEDDIRKVLKKLKRGTAPGASGCRYEHLKVCLGSEDMLSLLIPLFEDLANGDITLELRSLLGNSTLVAIPKSDGSPRPIALLETIRNIAGRLLLVKCIDKLRSKLFGVQFAVGIKGGVEIAIHAFRTLMSDHPEFASLLVDFQNMFNEISREGVLDTVRRHCPEAYPFIFAFYSRSADVAFRKEDGSFDEEFLRCSQGVFQGDTWGSVAACCLLLDFQLQLADELRAANLVVVQIAIADDLTFIGPSASVIAAWEFAATWPSQGLRHSGSRAVRPEDEDREMQVILLRNA